MKRFRKYKIVLTWEQLVAKGSKNNENVRDFIKKTACLDVECFTIDNGGKGRTHFILIFIE